jgi:hypothetical protein
MLYFLLFSPYSPSYSFSEECRFDGLFRQSTDPEYRTFCNGSVTALAAAVGILALSCCRRIKRQIFHWAFARAGAPGWKGAVYWTNGLSRYCRFEPTINLRPMQRR